MTRFTTRISKLLAGAAAATVLGLAPHLASAGEWHEHNRYDDGDRRHSDVRVDVEIGRGGGVQDRDHCEPVYEDRVTRVWVEPAYRTVSDRRWIEPETRTVCDRVYREAVTEDRVVCRYVPGHWEVRNVVDRDGCEHRQKVYVNGHDEKHHECVVVCPARWEDVQRQEVICPGHWEDCSRQEVVCPGHWEERHWEERRERVAVERHREGGLEVLGEIVAHIGR